MKGIYCAEAAAAILEERIRKRLMRERMACLMCVLDCAGDKDSKAVRAKAVKVLADLVQIDTGVLGWKPVSACLTAAIEVSNLSCHKNCLSFVEEGLC